MTNNSAFSTLEKKTNNARIMNIYFLHWKRVDDRIGSQRRLELQAQNVCAKQIGERLIHSIVDGELLEAHVTRGTPSTNKVLGLGSLEQHVSQVRMHPAVGLTVHGLGTQGSRHQIDWLVGEFTQLGGQRILDHAQLDQ